MYLYILKYMVKDIIEKYPVVYLKSSKNRLREYNFAVHNNLPKHHN